MDLDIVKIYDKFLYSVKYEEADENEYDRLFQQWNDVENVCQFMEDNSLFLKMLYGKELLNLKMLQNKS